MRKYFLCSLTTIMMLVSMLTVSASAAVDFDAVVNSDFSTYVKVLPDFSEADISTEKFAGEFIYRVCTDASASKFPGMIKLENSRNGSFYYWDETAVRNNYKLLFGAEMPVYRPSDRSGVSYADGKYRVIAASYGESYPVFDYIIYRNDGFDVIYTWAVEGELLFDSSGYKKQVICSARYADNEKGYVLISKGDYKPDRNVSVKINNTEISFDVDPMIINGRTMVPMRAIFETLGADVQWNGDTNTVTALRNTDSISLTINSTVMTVNGTEKTIDVAPVIIDSRTLVPVRAITEALGCVVEWDGTAHTVKITDDSSSVDLSAAEKYASEDYKKAYAAYLRDDVKKHHPDGLMKTKFYLAYINDDDIPELLIFESPSRVTGAVIYTYHDGSVVKIGHYGMYGGFAYLPGQSHALNEHNSYHNPIFDMTSYMRRDAEYTSIEYSDTYDITSANIEKYLGH